MIRNLPIRTRLTVIIMVITLVCLALVEVAFFVHYRRSVKQDLVQELTVLAEIVANRSTAALVFDDADLGRENLAALAAREGITDACILTPDGTLFAAYAADPDLPPSPVLQQDPGHAFGDGHLRITRPVMLDGSRIGTVCIRSDLREQTALLRQQVIIGLAIFVLVGVFAYLLAAGLRKSISAPLADLVGVATAVAAEHDFSVRARETGRRDELGLLVSAFNDMLEKIATGNAVLREQETRFRQIAEASPEALVVLDGDERVVYMNSKFVELFGYTREDIPDVEAWWPRAYPDPTYRENTRRDWTARVEQAVAADVEVEPVERVVSCKDGTTRNVLFRGAPLGDQFLVLLTDLTERVRSEKRQLDLAERLRQAQKMEAIGTLAGGVAHDFNNILAAIFGYAELARQALPPDSPAHEDLAGVQQAGNRARDLVQQILMFSRARPQSRQLVDVGGVLHEALGLIRAAVPATITIEQAIDGDLPPVNADPTSLHQVVMNLCTNASQAMAATGGTLRVSARRLEFAEARRTCGLLAEPGEYVVLEVGDTGPGLDPALVERIFEPYFTTKGVGDGTGMGLAVVHGIVSELQGRIELESRRGEGAVFRIFLPAHDRDAAPAEGAAADVGLEGHERVLFVDDEPAIVEAGTRLLAGLGYAVTPATSSADALAIFRADPDAFDVVVSDLTMPKMTGIELARELLALRPRLPIVLCSGYNVGISQQEAMGMGLRALAMKPLSRDALARLVREAVESPAAG